MPPIPDDYEIRVPFTVPEVHDKQTNSSIPSYTDTLFIPAGEFLKMTWDDVEAIKTERYTAWLDQILHPPVPEPVVVSKDEALLQAREALTAAMEAIDAVVEASAPIVSNN